MALAGQVSHFVNSHLFFNQIPGLGDSVLSNSGTIGTTFNLPSGGTFSKGGLWRQEGGGVLHKMQFVF